MDNNDVVVQLRRKRRTVFTTQERLLLNAFAECCQHVIPEARMSFLTTDEAEEFCVLLDYKDDDWAHFGFTDRGVFSNSESFGYLEAKTLNDLLAKTNARNGARIVLDSGTEKHAEPINLTKD